MFATLIECLLSFLKLIIEVYDAVEREVRIVLRNRRVNKKKFHRAAYCFSQLIIQMAQVLFFSLSLLYPWLRKRLRNFAHKRGNQVH